MHNTDLCTILLDYGRRKRKTGITLSTWIPKIRQYPTQITLETQLDWLPSYVQHLTRKALKHLKENPLPPKIKSPKPQIQNTIDPEFQRLVLTLPIPLRLRIFGYVLQCHVCRRRMCTIDTKVTDVKWLLYKDRPLCSRRCCKILSESQSAGISTLVDVLYVQAGIIDMYDGIARNAIAR